MEININATKKTITAAKSLVSMYKNISLKDINRHNPVYDSITYPSVDKLKINTQVPGLKGKCELFNATKLRCEKCIFPYYGPYSTCTWNDSYKQIVTARNSFELLQAIHDRANMIAIMIDKIELEQKSL